jgi:hypothetical protein
MLSYNSVLEDQESLTLLECTLAFANAEPEIVQYMVEHSSPIDARTIHEALMGRYRNSRSQRDVKADYLEIILRNLEQQAARDLVNAPFKNRGLEQFAALRVLVKSTQVLLKYGADPPDAYLKRMEGVRWISLRILYTVTQVIALLEYQMLGHGRHCIQ